MKKILSLGLIFVLLFAGNINSFAEEDDFISAKAAVVMCADTGEIVYSKNMYMQLSMASTTKIMTSVLALEYGATDSYITVTDEMVRVEGTSMGLLGGDRVSLKSLVKGMLIQSGNDAANAVAVIVGGSIPEFVAMMNEKAQMLGMDSTSFETPSGLDGDNHYSTARDMAVLAAYAIKNPEFRSICSLKQAVVYYGNPPYRRVMTNHNKLLSMYDGVFGIKTGFTKKSGRCLVTAAEKDGKTLIAVTLSAPDDWNDHVKLYDYAFECVKSVTLTEDLEDIRLKVVGGTSGSISVSIQEPLNITVASEDYSYYDRVLLKQFEYAPVYEGDIVGTLEFYNSDDEIIGSTPICAGETMLEAVTDETENMTESKKTFLDKIKELFR
ncbi:MAG: D-alanyl-D-alanine carboxypeptidase [Oscillospiraceae bacterium]|nr:D-alanyl-D-alanine carboxypeptidase [Oscillospiraceae bacterium]